jgi:hypothetical protein
MIGMMLALLFFWSIIMFGIATALMYGGLIGIVIGLPIMALGVFCEMLF